jgi:hypothetical protein
MISKEKLTEGLTRLREHYDRKRADEASFHNYPLALKFRNHVELIEDILIRIENGEYDEDV